MKDEKGRDMTYWGGNPESTQPAGAQSPMFSRVDKIQAKNILNRAVKKGILHRPTVCQRCGAAPPPAKDGRLQIHAHHSDYSKPLSVEWLCISCHYTEAPVIGENNGQARLNGRKVMEIRNSSLSAVVLARKLGVDRRTVDRARKGTHWKHISLGTEK